MVERGVKEEGVTAAEKRGRHHSTVGDQALAVWQNAEKKTATADTNTFTLIALMRTVVGFLCIIVTLIEELAVEYTKMVTEADQVF